MLPESVIRLPGTQGTQGPQGTQLAAARDGQRTTTCHGAAWQRSGEISGTPQNTWGGMQQMEKK